METRFEFPGTFRECVGVDAHIDPAVQTGFTGISGKFDGAKWGDVGIAPYALCFSSQITISF